jgi:hypothetical protein
VWPCCLTYMICHYDFTPPVFPANALPKCTLSSFCKYTFNSAENLKEHLYYHHSSFVSAPIELEYCYICQQWLNTYPDPFAIRWHKRAHAAQLLDEYAFTTTGMIAPLEQTPYRWIPLQNGYLVMWPVICPICLPYGSPR